MTRLHVNIDHIATLRQARGVSYPNPVFGVPVVEMAGAHGITVHLREDRRHISDRDVELIKETVSTQLNLEMACTDEIIRIAGEIRPDMCTLVPEKREERTTEGGLNVVDDSDRIKAAVETLGNCGIKVSLFINPGQRDIDASLETGARTVELHTGAFCDARDETEKALELDRINKAARMAKEAGLEVAAGHGLHYHNVNAVSRIPEIIELNIGHSIISRAVFTGLEKAVLQMLDSMRTS